MLEKLKEDILDQENQEQPESTDNTQAIDESTGAESLTQPPVDPTQEEKKQGSPDEIQANNFKAMRQKIAAAERERDEFARRLKEIEANPMRKYEPTEPDEDLDFNIAPDDLAEGKHLSKVAKKIRNLENQLRSYQQNTVAVTAETRLKTEFPDIEKVVSAENIQTLRDMYPEIAETLNSSNDLYTKAKAAYTMIKKFGIHAEDNYIQDKQLAQRNAAKPKPLASVAPQQGESPISRANAFANGLTEELKAQLRKEMDEAAKMM